MTSFKLVHYCSLAVKDVAISLKIGQPERETARGLTGWSKGQEEERVWGTRMGCSCAESALREERQERTHTVTADSGHSVGTFPYEGIELSRNLID